MTPNDRARLARIRQRKTVPGSDFAYLLELVEDLQRQADQARIDRSVYRELGDAYEQAASREMAVLEVERDWLRARVTELEQAMRAAGLTTPPGTPPTPAKPTGSS